MELNEEDFVRGLYFSMRREDLPKRIGIGREYNCLIYGHLPIPIGKRTILNWETDIKNHGIPVAIIQFIKYEHGTLDDAKATKISFKLEEFLN